MGAGTQAVTYGPPTQLPFTNLYSPTDIAVDGSGNVYVASGNVVELPKTATGWGKQVTLPFTGVSGEDSHALAVDRHGNVYVAYTNTFTSANNVVELPKTATGWGKQVTLPFTGFATPSGVAVDANGNVYVSYFTNNAVVELPTGATQASQLVTLPFSGLNGANSVAVDDNGDVYVSDLYNGRVVELPKTATGWGKQMTLPFTNLVTESTGKVAVDSAGNAYLIDYAALTYPGTRVVELPKTATGWGKEVTLPYGTTNIGSGLTIDGHGSAYVIAGPAFQAVYELPVEVPPDTVTVTNPGDLASAIGTNVHLQMQASASNGDKLSYSQIDLPDGLYLDPYTGLITGTPNTAQTVTVTVTATDTTTKVSATATFLWNVGGSPPDSVSVTDPGAQTSPFNANVRLQIHAASSTGTALTYHASGLPAGLTIDSPTGLITGVPTAVSSGPVTVTVSDGAGKTASVTFTWTISSTVIVTSPGNQINRAGQKASLPITASAYPDSPVTYSAASLPAGLSINSGTGLISGRLHMVASTVTKHVIISAADKYGATSSASFTWTITPVTGRIAGYKGECATDYHYLSAPGSPAVIRTCNTLLREKWTIGPHYTLISHGLCLTDPGWGRWRTKLTLETCHGWTNQQWSHHANGEYTVAVHGLCLTDPRWSTTGGTQLILQSCRDWTNQRWTRP